MMRAMTSPAANGTALANRIEIIFPPRVGSVKACNGVNSIVVVPGNANDRAARAQHTLPHTSLSPAIVQEEQPIG